MLVGGFCKEALPRVAQTRSRRRRRGEAELYWVHSCCLVNMWGETLIGGGHHPPACSTGPVRGDRVAVAKRLKPPTGSC